MTAYHVLTLIVFTIIQSACINCDCHTGWIHFQNSCYLFGNDKLNWYEASSSCLSHHANLVEVETVHEETFLKTTARAFGTHFWLGARDDITEGSWVWSADDSDLDYNDWYPNEPNNSGGNEDCLELSGEHSWQWNDGPCRSYSIQYICEKRRVFPFF
ncbi:low affinity immunoglobulin epsilon Fc receptor-like [Mytilus trossulus]|uniref:low affinity immunoglobulin epsilon Fc receptor-like n=1 Tax=Mytilus trossulus TaxID=6551 RepID=UPI0030054A5E